MKKIAFSAFVLFLSACGIGRHSTAPTYNEKLLEAQHKREAAGEDPYAISKEDPSSDPVQSSLWAKSVGSPYIIRNQKAQKVGDLLTIVVDESASATTSAKTDAKKEGKDTIGGTMGWGQGEKATTGQLSFDTNHKDEFKGEGKTDRSGRIQTTVQAVVESVLPNGTLFVRGQKVITINNEDQEVHVTGFVRPDDIRINNTVISSLMADAEIRYVGVGVISDKQRVGWGARLLDTVWPF